MLVWAGIEVSGKGCRRIFNPSEGCQDLELSGLAVAFRIFYSFWHHGVCSLLYKRLGLPSQLLRRVLQGMIISSHQLEPHGDLAWELALTYFPKTPRLKSSNFQHQNTS